MVITLLIGGLPILVPMGHAYSQRKTKEIFNIPKQLSKSLSLHSGFNQVTLSMPCLLNMQHGLVPCFTAVEKHRSREIQQAIAGRSMTGREVVTDNFTLTMSPDIESIPKELRILGDLTTSKQSFLHY